MALGPFNLSGSGTYGGSSQTGAIKSVVTLGDFSVGQAPDWSQAIASKKQDNHLYLWGAGIFVVGLVALKFLGKGKGK